MDTKNQEFYIGHREDAISLLDEMLGKCEVMNKLSLPTYQGMENATGSVGYFWPRLAALRDALDRWIA